MKYEIVYGEDPRAGVEPVVIGAVMASNIGEAAMKALNAIDEKLWPRIRTKPWTKRLPS